MFMGVLTGIGKLDDLIKSKVSEKTSILLLGPPKCGKTIFGMQFLAEGLKNKEYGICLITNNFPEEFVKSLEKFGDVNTILKEGMLKFVDCYSEHVGVEKENTLFILRVNGPTSLNEINIAISQILKEIPTKSKLRTVVDSISTLLLYNRPQTVAEFVQVIDGKMKSRGANSVYILEEGAHDEKDIITLSSMLDALIHFKPEKDKNIINVKGFGVETNLNYSVEGGKIICG